MTINVAKPVSEDNCTAKPIRKKQKRKPKITQKNPTKIPEMWEIETQFVTLFTLKEMLNQQKKNAYELECHPIFNP